jgi:hypothetical protein
LPGLCANLLVSLSLVGLLLLLRQHQGRDARLVIGLIADRDDPAIFFG